MSSELAIVARAEAVIRYDKELTIYQEIFGEKAVWCRAIPHITKDDIVVVK